MYLNDDDLQDLKNAHGFGVPISQLATQVGATEGELRRLLGLPAWMIDEREKQIPSGSGRAFHSQSDRPP